MPATESAPRVALLARPGAACDKVRAALNEAGAQVVLEAEPGRSEPADVQAAQPHVVMVVLDAVTEPAFERFEPVLAEAGIEIMFEEADVAAAREGWDAARWVRHLAAKLHRHDNVLPPGAPADDDAHHVVPSGVGAQPAEPQLSADEYSPAPELETFEFAAVAEPVAAHPLSEDFTAGVEPGGFSGFDPVSAEIAEAEGLADQVISFDFSPEAMSLDDLRGGSSGGDDASIDLVFDSERAEAEAVSFEFDGFAPVVETADAATADTRAEAPAASTAGLFSSLELATDDAPVATRQSAGTTFSRDLGDLEQRISSLSLVDPSTEVKRGGAVLVLAGIGGPDAVRQLLGALPQDFARPVIVQQRLDGGRYDKLVTQMQRASALPVVLASPGSPPDAGVVYMLPSDVGLEATPEGMRFSFNPDVLDALSPRDSAVLLLSGSDAALVPALTSSDWSRGLVAGQSPEDCYDAAAPSALAAAGGTTARPNELASRLAERWAH